MVFQALIIPWIGLMLLQFAMRQERGCATLRKSSMIAVGMDVIMMPAKCGLEERLESKKAIVTSIMRLLKFWKSSIQKSLVWFEKNQNDTFDYFSSYFCFCWSFEKLESDGNIYF